MSINLNPNVTPRLIFVPSLDGTEITMQELVTQVRDWEDEPSNLAYPYVMRASGKEDLGGGVTVGITTQLQNAKLAFEQRAVSVSAGTVTTIDTGGLTLIDSAATFITDGVIEGASIINFTDQSVGTVLTIDSETQITLLTGLEDGIDNQWDSADVYKIWNIIQCEASGGNLTSVDVAGLTIDSVFPTFGTQIVRTSSASATLSEQADIEFSSFNGGITIDVTSIYSGTSFPIGTPREPVNNVLDAITIANTRGLPHLFIIGDVTFTTGHVLTSFQVTGESSTKSTITVDSGAVVDGIEIREANVTGTLDGDGVLEKCVIGALNFFEGTIRNCAIENVTIVLGGTATTHLENCHAQVPSGTPIIDMGGGGRDLISVGWTGRIKFINMSTANLITCEGTTGKLEFDSTITNGTLTAQGQGLIVDNSTGTTLTNPGFMNRAMIADSVWDEDLATHTTADTFGEMVGARLLTFAKWLGLK